MRSIIVHKLLEEFLCHVLFWSNFRRFHYQNAEVYIWNLIYLWSWYQIVLRVNCHVLHASYIFMINLLIKVWTLTKIIRACCFLSCTARLWPCFFAGIPRRAAKKRIRWFLACFVLLMGRRKRERKRKAKREKQAKKSESIAKEDDLHHHLHHLELLFLIQAAVAVKVQVAAALRQGCNGVA